MTILSIIGGVLVAFLAILLIVLILLVLVHLWLFHSHRCQHCGHIMEYKGLTDDNEGGHFIFHCPQCGTVQHILKTEFLR